MNELFAAVAALIALVVFSAPIARSQILADVLTLNSGEKVDGRITAESDLSVTISTATSTGKPERMIPRSEIVGETRSEPLAPPRPEPGFARVIGSGFGFSGQEMGIRGGRVCPKNRKSGHKRSGLGFVGSICGQRI